MLAKDPSHRITSEDALNHPAFTKVLSLSPLSTRNVFDNRDLINFNAIKEEYDQKIAQTKKANMKSFGGVPDNIEDMSPSPMNQKNKTKDSAPKFKFNLPARAFSPINPSRSPARNNKNNKSNSRSLSGNTKNKNNLFG